jgi:hypothetical protein
MRNMLIKHEGTWNFEVGEHVWLNIWDFKMPNGLALCFIVKYARPYETLHKLNFDVYILKFVDRFCGTFNLLHFKIKLVSL